MNKLWQSEDGYMFVVDGVNFPDDEGNGNNDIATLFNAGVWVVVWRAAEDGEHDMLWHVTRNRRYAQPNLLQLRGRMKCHEWLIYPSGAGGRQNAECDVDPVAFAQALYAAWGEEAARKIPAKIAHLQLNEDDYDSRSISSWLRPGIPGHRASRMAIRELYEEIRSQECYHQIENKL